MEMSVKYETIIQRGCKKIENNTKYNFKQLVYAILNREVPGVTTSW